MHIGCEHACTRLAGGQIIGWKTAVNVYGIEIHAFAMQYVKHKLMGGQEVAFGIGFRPEAVLIGHHDKLIIGVLAQEAQCADGSRHEAELLEAVDLLVGRLHQNGSVAVYEECFPH